MHDEIEKYRNYITYDDDLNSKENSVKKLLYYYAIGYEKSRKHGFSQEFANSLSELKSEESEAMLEGYYENKLKLT